MTETIHGDGWPHAADGWVYESRPHTECKQRVDDDTLEERLDRYRKLAEKGKPLFEEV